MSTCIIKDCGKRMYAFGLCPKHYTRQRRYGDPLGGGTSPGVPLQYLQEHVDYDGDDCVPWPFAKFSDGYGAVTFRGQQTTANNVMCTLAHGEPPTPLYESAHSCGRGHEGCVSPRHLRWATRSENHADKVAHGTHSRGERASGVVLSVEQVHAIRSLKGRVRQKILSAQYGVTIATVSAIQCRKIWAWLESAA